MLASAQDTSIPVNPIFCALDTDDGARACHLAGALSDIVGGLKVGKELFTAQGPQLVQRLAAASGLPLFLDLKFHDIPNTVFGAVRAACKLNPFMLTLHTSGGPAMLKAARDAVDELPSPRPLLLGVTVLTSMTDEDLELIGMHRAVADQVFRLAELAATSGLDGVVCSPLEIVALRRRFGTSLKFVIPGIRPRGAAVGDQRRQTTPEEALADGADYLVIGRPITAAPSPTDAASEIVRQIFAVSR